MAWRFKASKYKNAAPMIPKKELWIRDVDAGSPVSGGMSIAASASLMAMVVKNRNGGSLAVLPVNDHCRHDRGLPLLAAHADVITDLHFSPFDDGLLATGSADCSVRVWSLGDAELSPEPELSLETDGHRLERVLFHPAADCLLSAAFGQTIRLWDILHQRQLYSWSGHDDQVQSLSWREGGSCLASTCRDTQLRILDPRADKLCGSTQAHAGSRDSWVTWLGDTDQMVTTGFDQYRQRQLCLRDVRHLDRPVKTITSDSCTGLLVPLYDSDTKMLFLAGKGDSCISYMEITDKEPYFAEGLKHTGEQTKGACLVPKRALNVMQAEVNRILQQTQHAVIPISYQVPRKTYREFHADLFPATAGADPAMAASQWWDGADRQPRRVSLEPAATAQPLTRRRKRLQERKGEPEPQPEPEPVPEPEPEPEPKHRIRMHPLPSGKPAVKAKPTTPPKPASPKPDAPAPWRKPRPASETAPAKPAKHSHPVKEDNGGDDDDEPVEVRPRRASSDQPPEDQRRSAGQLRRAYEQRLSTNGDADKPAGPTLAPKHTPVNKSFRRVSKCRFMKGIPVHKSDQFENIKNLNKSTTNECNGIIANASYAAILLAGAGGKVCVVDLSQPGRQQDGVVPCFLNGAKVMDFAWDPFDDSRIAVACDDGAVRVWRVPEGGLQEPTNECEMTLASHQDKVLTLQFHPLARGVLATAGQDRRTLVWLGEEVKLELEHHPEQVFSMAWSPCGRYLATLAKDARLRVFEPRAGPAPLRDGPSHRGARGGRVCWVLGGSHIVTTGFDKSSERQISLYKASDLSKPVTTLPLDVSPSILMPHYDPDTSTLFLTAKGDTSILGYEVALDFPHLFPLTPYKTGSCHQGAGFLPKNTCDVRKVEFARCLRLLPNAIVPIAFCVPRVKTELFQDDLFPPTTVTWEPTMDGQQWLDGANVPARTLDMQPADMTSLSQDKADSQSDAPPAPKSATETNGQAHVQRSSFAPKPDKKKAEQVESALSDRLATNFTLEQDTMEGVAEEEWEE